MWSPPDHNHQREEGPAQVQIIVSTDAKGTKPSSAPLTPGRVSTRAKQCGAMKLKKILRSTTSAKCTFTTAPATCGPGKRILGTRLAALTSTGKPSLRQW